MVNYKADFTIKFVAGFLSDFKSVEKIKLQPKLIVVFGEAVGIISDLMLRKHQLPLLLKPRFG